MDTVVILAFLVLFFVFCLSLTTLIVICIRRRANRRAAAKAAARLLEIQNIENAENIVSLEALGPLIGDVLDKNAWMYDASGSLQHCVAILRLCRTLTDKLAAISLSNAKADISEAICMATRNIYPRFDDLLDVVASPTIDMRVLEARTMALATVCWALYLPFLLLDSKNKALLLPVLAEMNAHLIVIRQTVKTAVSAKKETDEGESLDDVKSQLIEIRSNIRNQTILEENEDVQDEMEPCTSASSSEITPLVDPSEPSTSAQPSPIKRLINRMKSPPKEIPKEEVIEMITLTNLDDDEGIESARKMCNGATVIERFKPLEELHDDSVGGSSSLSTSSESSAASSHPIDPKF